MLGEFTSTEALRSDPSGEPASAGASEASGVFVGIANEMDDFLSGDDSGDEFDDFASGDDSGAGDEFDDFLSDSGPDSTSDQGLSGMFNEASNKYNDKTFRFDTYCKW